MNMFDLRIVSNMPEGNWLGSGKPGRNSYSASSAKLSLVSGVQGGYGTLQPGAPDDIQELISDLRYWRSFKGNTRRALRDMSRTAAAGIRESITNQVGQEEWPELSESYKRWKDTGEISKRKQGFITDPSGYGGRGNAEKMLIYTGEYVESIGYREIGGVGDAVEFEVGSRDDAHQQLAYSLEYGGPKPSALEDKYKWAPHVLARPHMGLGYEYYHKNVRDWWYKMLRYLARKPSTRPQLVPVMTGGAGIGI